MTIADLVKINSNDVDDHDITDLLNDAPFIRALVADTASNGTSHKYTKESSAPVVGFRAANAGRAHSKSGDTLVTIDLKILDASVTVDKAIADAYTKGGPDALMAREGKRHLRAAFAAAEAQLLYGVGAADAGGFVGLADATTLDHTTDAQVVDATGATACSSVYAIRSIDELSDVALITGNDGSITVGERFDHFAIDGDGKKFPAYGQAIEGWLALQIGSIHSVARLANLDATTKGLNDDLLSDLLSLAPSSRPFTMLVMNRRSLKQLQQSRTATNASGAAAPFPTEAFNVPIIVTDAVSSAETALVAEA
tara:strand:- start:17767 stop:18699 length:933 start_codon:yes stop_codon:yes gene_type:complete